MEKEKRKRGSRRFRRIPYTLIGFGIVIVVAILGFQIGTTIVSLPERALWAEWDEYSTQTATYKSTHNPIIPVTQTVEAIETQWAEINITQTAIDSELRDK